MRPHDVSRTPDLDGCWQCSKCYVTVFGGSITKFLLCCILSGLIAISYDEDICRINGATHDFFNILSWVMQP